MSMIGVPGSELLELHTLGREDAFSYRCQSCGRCCYHKRIPLGPLEVLRLARHLGLSTGEFLRRCARDRGPWLRNTETGACVFLDGSRCGVHADRPLACRLWPLGRKVARPGQEHFGELLPEVGSEGIYGRDGTVGGYLEGQGALPFLEMADRYHPLLCRLAEAVRNLLPARPSLPWEARTMMLAPQAGADRPAYMEWLDVDQAVEGYCRASGRPVPADLDGLVDLHIASIAQCLPDPAAAHRGGTRVDSDPQLRLAIAATTLGMALGIDIDTGQDRRG